MRHWSYKKKVNQLAGQTRDQYPTCESATFGGDPWPGLAKECWCEPKPIHYPSKCADEGENCLCTGDIYFMSNNVNGKTNPHYIESVNENYTANTMNSSTSIVCNASSFEFTDPLPGVKKQCMCDNSKTVTNQENIQIIKDSWRSKKLVNQLHDILVTAEAKLKNETDAADASQKLVDGLANATVTEDTVKKEEEDKAVIDALNSTGRATCSTAKQTSLDSAAKKAEGVSAAEELASSTKIAANASLAASIKDPSDANSAKAASDETAAIDAAIALAGLKERISNSEQLAEKNY